MDVRINSDINQNNLIMKKILITLLSILSIQGFTQDGCEEVLRLASRNVEIKYSRASVAKYVYENYCEGNRRKSSVNFGVDVGSLMESVGFSFGSKSDNIKHICETYQSNYKGDAEEYSQSNNVVNDALRYWYECKKLSSEKIIFTPTVLKTTVNINVRNQNDLPAFIKNISYDTTKLECRCEVNGGKQIVNIETPKFKIEPGENPITCTRIPVKTKGLDYYDETEIVVATNKGSFSLIIPKEGKPGINWLTEIDAKISSLQNQINETKKYQILAVLRVEGSKLISATKGVTFDTSSGNVVFENPQEMKYVPLISDLFIHADYMTTTNFARQIISSTEFKVRRTTLDTGARNNVPTDFIALVIGFKDE